MSRMLKWRKILRSSQQGKAAEPFFVFISDKVSRYTLEMYSYTYPGISYIKRIFSFFF